MNQKRIDDAIEYLRKHGTEVAFRDPQTAVNLKQMINDALAEFGEDKPTPLQLHMKRALIEALEKLNEEPLVKSCEPMGRWVKIQTYDEPRPVEIVFNSWQDAAEFARVVNAARKPKRALEAAG